MNEQQVQKKILQYLTRKGIYTIKVISASKRGVPDIIACYKGKFIGIEVKKDFSSKPTELQKKNLFEIKQAKGYAFVAYGYKDFINTFEQIEEDLI